MVLRGADKLALADVADKPPKLDPDVGADRMDTVAGREVWNLGWAASPIEAKMSFSFAGSEAGAFLGGSLGAPSEAIRCGCCCCCTGAEDGGGFCCCLGEEK